MLKNASIFTVILLSLLGLIFSPSVIANSNWDEDGWLNTSLATERLNNGDEFGCYDIPGLSWKSDPGAVAGECREYIEKRVDASLWGKNPVSTFTPNSLTMAQHQIISQQGFVVHGDDNSLSYTAWHNSTDIPADLWDWYNIGRRGGSLEQVVGSADTVKDAVEEGGLVNLYWIGRVNEATIRHDSEIEDYISDDADAWLTTWGQAWSYWVKEKCYQFDHSVSEVGDNYVISFKSLDTEQCGELFPERWNIPITWMLDIKKSSIISISSDDVPLQDITDSRHTEEGYTQSQDGYLLLSIKDEREVNITVTNSTYDVVGIAEFWNNHSAAITIAAHETTDLFKWSKRFADQDDLVFTWLLQPRPLDAEATWIPYVAFAIGSGVILSMLLILKREGLGPLAPK